ncbi:MAG: PAS domain S-box protein [Chloroflexi bacterium]|nr:PAS domain S-box protein [Chloroflexota bacterium]
MNTLERRVWLGFGVVVFVAILIGALVWQTTSRLNRSQDGVANTYQTLSALDATLSALQDVETGQRGYVVTGDRAFLEPHDSGIERVAASLAVLKTLLAGDPGEEGQLARLEGLAAEKIAFAREAVAVRDQAGRAAAEILIAGGRGEAVMDDVRAVIASLKQGETEELQRDTRASDADTRNSNLLTGGIAVLALLLFAALLFAVTRALGSQRRAAEADARFGAIVGASTDAIMSLDLDGNIQSWNDGATRIFGYTAAEAIDKHVSILAPADGRAAQADTVRSVREGGRLTNREAVRVAKDGTPLDVSLSVFLLHDAEGKAIGMASMVRDISETKRAERALQESQQRFAAVFDQSPAGISITRLSDGLIADVNQRLLDLLGFSREEVIGHSTLDLGIWVNAEARAELARQVVEEGRPRDAELQWRARDGNIVDSISSWALLELGEERFLVSLITDITDRKRAERALSESQARFAAVFEASPMAITITDLDTGAIVDVNTAWSELTGFSREEAVGRTSGDLGLVVEAAARGEVYDRARQGLEVHGADMRIRARAGELRDVVVSSRPLEIEGRTRLLSLVDDVTEQRRLERDLDRLFSTSRDFICIAGTDGYFKRLNPSFERVLGYSEAELLSRPIVEFVHPEDATPTGRIIADQAGGQQVSGFTNRYRGRDGTYHWLEWNSVPDRDSGLIYAVARDITAQRELEDALRAGEERFRSVIETATDAIIITDRRGVIEVFNPAAEQTFGYAAAEVVGENVKVLIPSPDREAHDGYIADYLARGTSDLLSIRREMVGERKDGSIFPHELTVNPMQLAGDLKFTAIIRDIADRRRMENELRQSKDAAEEANRAKSQFLSRMSHELRTPLNVVLGFAQVLQLDPLDEPQTEAVDHILKAGRHLLELIDEVLDISRIEAGRLSLSIEPVHAGQLLTDTLALIRPLADQRQITIQAEDAACHDYILADRQRLKQVLLNLLSNAIKYNRIGGRVQVTCPPVEAGLRLMVTDTGPGLPPDKLQRLFNPFDRLGAEVTGVEGTGLGLALSKHLVEAMGGTIGVESTPGIGSSFWVELPLAEAPAALPGPEPTAEPGGAVTSPKIERHTILYIEDNLSNLHLMERILTHRHGFRLVAAMQGSLGLDLAREHHPDLILLDLHLPDMPGEVVLRELQLNPATSDIPVVILSADASRGQVARLLDAGARAYLTKPFDVAEFLSVTDSILQGPAE